MIVHTGYRVTWADGSEADWPCIAISVEGTALPRWNGFADVYLRVDDTIEALESLGASVLVEDEGLIVRTMEDADDDLLPYARPLSYDGSLYVHMSGYTLSYVGDFDEVSS
jgi:hypothetical protein